MGATLVSVLVMVLGLETGMVLDPWLGLVLAQLMVFVKDKVLDPL
jgi:hypothetical protein